MKTIKANQTLKCRSIGDSDCIFKLNVTDRKGNFATIEENGKTRRTKVYLDMDGNEYLMPEKYSFAPIFRAIN
jgi:hypothetical protein